MRRIVLIIQINFLRMFTAFDESVQNPQAPTRSDQLRVGIKVADKLVHVVRSFLT